MRCVINLTANGIHATPGLAVIISAHLESAGFVLDC